MVFIDKILLFCISIVIILSIPMQFMYDFNNSHTSIMIFLLCLIQSVLMGYFDNDKIRYGLFFCFLFMCLYHPLFLLFMPPVCKDMLKTKGSYLLFLLLVPFLVHYHAAPLSVYSILLLIFFISLLLEARQIHLSEIKQKYILLADQTKETSIQYAEKMKEFIEKQDYEIHLATLTERNRIARDIHDNVGHLLASALLQTGALLTITKDAAVFENLHHLKDTLSDAMNSIRSNVHNLHDQSIDLYTEVKKAADPFTFCTIEIIYDIDEILQNAVKYCFIAVVKEALANISKYSNAENVSILLREHPAFYQLTIMDNGKGEKKLQSEPGIGLISIKERVEALNGIIHIKAENGFRIFITIPKG